MSYEVNLPFMDAINRFRLLVGPARPFILGKVRDAVRRPLALRAARSAVPTAASTSLSLRARLRPLPSDQWLTDNREDVMAFARSMSQGAVHSHGISEWRIGEEMEDVEPRGVLEVARMHQWPAYALAVKYDGARWRDQLVKEIDLFRAVHPAFSGPLWSVAMDVALRVHNMLLAVDWLMQIDPAFHESEQGHAFERRVAAFAIDHAVAIDAMLETAGGMSTSHLLGDLLGLIAVGVHVQGEDEVVARARTAFQELEAEMDKQVLTDGMSFEASTGYHRHVVDILVHAFALAHIASSPGTGVLGTGSESTLGSWVMGPGSRQLSLMIQRQRQLESCGMPLIGDNDDGMAVKLRGFRPTTLYMYEAASQIPGLLPGNDLRTTSPLQHFAMDDFGLDLYKHQRFVLTARCGPIGQYGKGGHAHNDQNAITLFIDDEPVIIDPGSSWYGDAVARNADRSVKSHATVVVNNEEQNLFARGTGEDLWWMLGDRVKGAVVTRTPTTWEGVAGPHRRSIEINEDDDNIVITIHDRIDVNCTGEVRMPLAHSMKVEMSGNEAHLRGRRAACVIRWDGQGRAAVERQAVSYAPRFARPEPSDVLSVPMTGTVITWTITLPR